MKNKIKNLNYVVCVFAIVFLLTGCADVNPHAEACVTSDPYGFWSGLWHGLILPFSWIGSLFNSDIAIYACNNNGGWYDFGFVIGLGVFGGSSGKIS